MPMPSLPPISVRSVVVICVTILIICFSVAYMIYNPPEGGISIGGGVLSFGKSSSNTGPPEAKAAECTAHRESFPPDTVRSSGVNIRRGLSVEILQKNPSKRVGYLLSGHGFDKITVYKGEGESITSDPDSLTGLVSEWRVLENLPVKDGNFGAVHQLEKYCP